MIPKVRKIAPFDVENLLVGQARCAARSGLSCERRTDTTAQMFVTSFVRHKATSPVALQGAHV